ncbi:MAG: gliding motility-associated protein GldE [Nitritalea sp.]
MDDPYPSWLFLDSISTLSFSYLFGNASLFVLLLIASGLVSGSEVAFFSLTSDDLVEVREQGDGKSEKIISLLGDPQRLLSTILILNNLINIGMVTLSTFFLWEVFGGTTSGLVIILAQTLGVTFAIVFFGEIVPKVYATRARIAFARVMAPFLAASSWLLKPLSLFLMSLGRLIQGRVEKKSAAITREELNQALEITTQDTSDNEKEILKGIVNFGALTVKQVMRSRMEITALEDDTPFTELLEIIRESGFSRIPVYHETIDQISGILYIKDLLPHLQEAPDFEWVKLLRKSYFVPENKKVDSLLKDFQQKRVHMAIVVDEYGGTSGLVTLEDLIEEIIGEINDEFDEGEDFFFKDLGNDTYVVEGKLSLNDFCKKLGVDAQVFDEVKGESESLAGLLLEMYGHFPKPGTTLEHAFMRFTVVGRDDRKINKIKVKVLRTVAPPDFED